MVDAREAVLGLSGGFFLTGALSFVIDLESDETFMFVMFSLIGALLMFAGLLMKGCTDVKNIRKASYFVIGAGIIIFLVSVLISWDPMEILILMTCGAYSIIMYALSLRIPVNYRN